MHRSVSGRSAASGFYFLEAYTASGAERCGVRFLPPSESRCKSLLFLCGARSGRSEWEMAWGGVRFLYFIFNLWFGQVKSSVNVSHSYPGQHWVIYAIAVGTVPRGSENLLPSFCSYLINTRGASLGSSGSAFSVCGYQLTCGNQTGIAANSTVQQS